MSFLFDSLSYINKDYCDYIYIDCINCFIQNWGDYFLMQVSELCCKKCEKVKPISEFDRVYFGKKGYDVYCRDCRIELDKIFNLVVEKRCRQCGRLKSVSEFGKTDSTRDGYYKECFDCQEENNSRRRERKFKNVWDGKMSICRICGQQKPTYEFIAPRYKTSGYCYCRRCIYEKIRYRIISYEQIREKQGWPVEKRCMECGRKLASDKFHLNRRRPDGLDDKCIDCYREQQTQWLEGVKEKHSNKRIKKNTLKECYICHIIKPMSSFTKNKSSIDGHSDMCITCTKNVREENAKFWDRKRKEKKVGLKEMKCRICGLTLPIKMFNKNKERKNGYYNFCKNCQKNKIKEIEKRWEQERNKARFEFSLDEVLEKKCKICGKILPVSKFWKRRASKDGYGHYCKECESNKIKKRNKLLKKRSFPEELIPKEKHCNKCGRLLPSSKFSRDSTASDGLSSICKECYSEYYKEYSNRPEVKQRNWEYNRRPEVMERKRMQKKEYYKRPEVKKRINNYKREYRKRPYVKEQRKEYEKEYSKRPEVIKRRRKLYREYIKDSDVKNKRLS